MPDLAVSNQRFCFAARHTQAGQLQKAVQFDKRGADGHLLFFVKHLFTGFKADGENKIGEIIPFNGTEDAGRKPAFQLENASVSVDSP